MKKIIINGESNKIDARYHFVNKRAPVMTVLHGHPKNGGSVHHPVTQLVCKTFVDLGFNVLTFNYRGVGSSEGEFSHGEKEVLDGAVCLDWLRNQGLASRDFWVSGFAFGGWVALQLLMRRPDCSRFIVMNLPVNNAYDFSFLSPCPQSGLIISGGNDPMVLPESLVKFRQSMLRQNAASVRLEFAQIPNAGHDFQGKTPEETKQSRESLVDKIKGYVRGVEEEKGQNVDVL